MKVIILGGGFAGIAAAKKLYQRTKNTKDLSITLLDKNLYTTMHPSLPDIAGGKIEQRYATEAITKLIPGAVTFQQVEIEKVDLVNKKIRGAAGEEFTYDKLVLAGGSKTNYFNFNQNLDKLYSLDCMEDAMRIQKAFQKRLDEKKEFNLVIAGAGFTGLELACSLYEMAVEQKIKVNITIVEKAKKIMSILSQKLICEIEKESALCNFNFLTDEEVASFDGNAVHLKNNGTIDNAFFCWCCGVKVSLNLEGQYQKLWDGRILVDPYLRIPEFPDVYAVGDSAAIKKNESYIRRAVNFAYTSGICAAENLANEIQGKPLMPYKPVDLGWVIPIHISSVGEALGFQVKGRLGILLHYILSGIKNYNFRNFLQYVGYAFRFALKKHTKIEWN